MRKKVLHLMCKEKVLTKVVIKGVKRVWMKVMNMDHLKSIMVLQVGWRKVKNLFYMLVLIKEKYLGLRKVEKKALHLICDELYVLTKVVMMNVKRV